MNIAIVVRSLKIGGMERVAANLSDAFHKNGHNTTLIYFKNKPIEITPKNSKTDIKLLDLKKLLIKSGIGLIWLSVSNILNLLIRKSQFFWLGFLYSKIFKKELEKIESEKGKFDLIIFRGQGTFEMVWNFKNNRAVQVCENIFNVKKANLKSKFFSKILFNHKNIVCVSNGVYNNFKSFKESTDINPASVSMITNPIDIQNIGALKKEKLPDIPKEPYILGLGRFAWQKNFPLLIEAYKILVDNYSLTQKLVLVGYGKEENRIKDLVKKLGLKERILFPGSTDNPYAWMANSDLFVLSSRFEGLGMVIIEAFASGTNVVATNCPGGVSDIMNHGSLKEQLSEMTPESLAEIVFKTLKKDFPSNDINTTLEKFNPDKIVNDYLKLIEN